MTRKARRKMIKVLVLLGLSLVSAGLMLSFKKRHCSTSALKASFHDYHICQCARCIDLIEHICHEIGCEEILLDEELCSHCGIRYCCEHIRSHEQLCAYFQPVVDARSATLACLADLADRGLLSQSIQDESSQYRLALSLARAELSSWYIPRVVSLAMIKRWIEVHSIRFLEVPHAK